VLFFGFGHSTGYGREFFNGDRPSVRDRYDWIKLGINFIRDHYHAKFPNFWLADVPGDEAKLLFRSFVRCDYEYAYEFLNSRMDFGKIVVRGHTLTKSPKCYRTGSILIPARSQRGG